MRQVKGFSYLNGRTLLCDSSLWTKKFLIKEVDEDGEFSSTNSSILVTSMHLQSGLHKVVTTFI